jgi:hypothetical protein|tara:strand:- start:1229 stop:1567 length:339 start_codon:yes stop_codon:yes gene_type:complete
VQPPAIIMSVWDDFFGNNTYNRHWINRNSENWYIAMLREMNKMMDEALDESVPIEQPKTKVVSTKTVKRNGKTYRITVERILEEEVPESDDASVNVSDKDDDFDSDFTEDNI